MRISLKDNPHPLPVRERGFVFWIILTIFILAAGFLAAGYSFKKSEFSQLERSIELVETVHLVIPKSSRRMRLWVPIPITDSHQETELLAVESPFAYRITNDRTFGNSFLYFEKGGVQSDKIEIKARYKILRKEQQGLGNKDVKRLTDQEKSSAILRYLKPRGLEVINDEIREIAEKTTLGIHEPVERARALYQYVLKHMQYDKTGAGWGRGDVVYACTVGKGNCTDFHALFIALARASGIPAKFRMGFSLPPETEGKSAGSYHCWAEFYIVDRGWIPVDISEAWKNPKMAEYYFGNLDVNRVLITTGREIQLSPKQNGAALNYLSQPYLELDGKPYPEFELERTFKNKEVQKT